MTSGGAHLKIGIGERKPNLNIFPAEITDGVYWIKHFGVIFKEALECLKY